MKRSSKHLLISSGYVLGKITVSSKPSSYTCNLSRVIQRPYSPPLRVIPHLCKFALDLLPEEGLQHILKFLPVDEYPVVSCVGKKYYRILKGTFFVNKRREALPKLFKSKPVEAEENQLLSFGDKYLKHVTALFNLPASSDVSLEEEVDE